eukprot:g10632.t2
MALRCAVVLASTNSTEPPALGRLRQQLQRCDCFCLAAPEAEGEQPEVVAELMPRLGFEVFGYKPWGICAYSAFAQRLPSSALREALSKLGALTHLAFIRPVAQTGVNAVLTPLSWIARMGLGHMSTKGRTFTYDASCDGWIKSDSFASLVMDLLHNRADGQLVEDHRPYLGCTAAVAVSHILDVNIFAYDYTGYGMSTGTPSEEALYADIEAAFKYLRDIVGIPWSEIVLYGRSIGSGPSIHLATRTAVRAMVLQSPLLSIYRVAFSSSFTLPGDMFPNVDRIGCLDRTGAVPVPQKPKPEPRVGGDAELEKLQIQRNAILTARKWQSSVLAISQEVAKSLGDAATVADATGFSDVVKTRFDKLMALAPKVELSPSKTALASGSHESLRSALSPISKAKVQQLDHPTKKSLSEYDKSMSSLESSLNKAIKSCNQYVTKAKLEEERERAKKVRLEQLREKEEKKRKQELAKAKAAGKALADQEGGQETAEQNGEEENDEDVWPLVSTADELLTSPLSKHVRDIKSPSATEPTVFDFAVDRLTKHLIDVKLYDPSECKKMRQKNPDGAANFISKGHVHPLTCFEDEPDSDVHNPWEDLIRNCQEGIAYPPYMVENGGHNNLEVVARQPFYENFTKFLQWLEKSDIADELTLAASLGTPHGPGVQRIIADACRQGEVQCASVDAMECHGEGLALNDAIELSSLCTVMNVASDRLPLQTSSVKTNLGYGLHGAGLAQMLKNLMIATENLTYYTRSSVHGVISNGWGGTMGCVMCTGALQSHTPQETSRSMMLWLGGGGQAPKPEKGYFITGSWDDWNQGIAMMEEAPGIYVASEFQIALDSTGARCLKPQEGWTQSGSRAFLHEKALPRGVSWRLLGEEKSNWVVRLVTSGKWQAQRSAVLVPGSAPRPVGLWTPQRPAGEVTSAMLQILIEERLGYLVTQTLNGSETSDAFYALCRCEPTAATAGALCGEGLHDVTLDAWTPPGYWERLIQTLDGRISPPRNLGNMGYFGTRSIYLPREVQEAAYEAEGLALQFYLSYNTTWHDATKYFAQVNGSDSSVTERLKFCNETRLMSSSLMTGYLRVTGDLDGLDNSTGELHGRCFEEFFWLAPKCRGLGRCVMFFTGGDGWNLEDRPLAQVADVRIREDLVALPREVSPSLFYWWALKPMELIGPRHDPMAHAAGDYQTAAPEVSVDKYVSQDLALMAPQVLQLLEAFQLPLSAVNGLLEDQVTSGDSYQTVACRWLQGNQELWQTWLPAPASCSEHFGLFDQTTGAFVGAEALPFASGDLDCQPCEGGYFSARTDGGQSTYLCLPCGLGTFQAQNASLSCNPIWSDLVR